MSETVKFCPVCGTNYNRKTVRRNHGKEYCYNSDKHFGHCHAILEKEVVNFEDLRDYDYINCDGEVMTKVKVKELIDKGLNIPLYTVSDEWVSKCLESMHDKYMSGNEGSDVYTAPDPNAKLILFKVGESSE